MSSLKKVFFQFILLFFAYQTLAWGGTIDLGKGIAQDQFKSLSKELGLAVSYIPASPAEPLGITGFDVGLEVTVAPISEEQIFWKTVAPDAPSALPLPKIHVQKGLPFGIDVGVVYSSVPQLDLSVVGGEIKYALLSGNVALPAVSVRGAYTQLAGLDSLDLSTFSADLSVSKGFALVTPYLGVGQVQVTSKGKAGASALTEEKQDLSKSFVGVKVSLALINFVAEADFAEVPLYTLRVNVGF